MFVARVFDIWNNSILFFEQGYAGQATATATGATPVQYYYRNLINLVVSRAIVNRKMDGLNALGPLFPMLKERVSVDKDGEGNILRHWSRGLRTG